MKQQCYVCSTGQTYFPLDSEVLVGRGMPATCPVFAKMHVGMGQYKMQMQMVEVPELQKDPFQIVSGKVTKSSELIDLDKNG